MGFMHFFGGLSLLAGISVLKERSKNNLGNRELFDQFLLARGVNKLLYRIFM
jgi:hypothetical protein